jgi:lipopolysaccharide biosynthesis glycosyltransferase
MSTETIKIYCGYDPREAIAYHTFSNSVIRHSSMPVSITPLALKNLESFYSNSGKDGSNQFIYSRFLVPYLSNYQGWSLFCDGDMILRSDVKELWDMRDDSKAVMVVKHDYKTKMEEKYLGSKNENYPRKNWSSVILFNNALCTKLTPEFVEDATGAELHRFYWLNDDDLVGEIPAEWNWLDIEYDYNPDSKLIHYTLGTPSFVDFSSQPDASFDSEWHRERIYTEYCKQPDIES